jgi:hypothetical protein
MAPLMKGEFSMLLIVYVVMFDSSRRSSRVRFKEGVSLKEVENTAKVSRPKKKPKFSSKWLSLCFS